MQIDLKRVFKIAISIAVLIAFAMLIPTALDNKRRYKEAQAKQVADRTMFYSSPATPEEQKAIIKVLLSDILMPSPAGLQAPSQLHKLALLEQTAFCSDLKFDYGSDEVYYLPPVDMEACSHGLLAAHGAYIDTVWPEDMDYLGLVSDMFKANRVVWLNPYFESEGIVFLTNEKTKKINMKLDCAFNKNCWQSIQTKIPGIRQYVHFSRAVVAKDRHSAVVYMGIYTPDVSEGGIVYLKFKDGVWHRPGGRFAWRTHNWGSG